VRAFSSPFTAVTQATFTAAGTYVLRLTANDTTLSSSSEVIVTVAVLPVGVLKIDQTAPITQATFFAPGSYLLQLTASDGVFTSTSQTTIVVFPANNGVNQAPIVDAGPSQVVVLPSKVTLNGSAVDDGLPIGNTLNIFWQQLSGPGTLTFDSPNSAQTTASFSQAGTYELQLSATDGQLLSVSTVTVHVFNLGSTRTNKGMDFWLAFPGNLPPSQAQGPQLITMFIGSETNTSGTFSIPGLGISQSFTVTAGQITAINVPLNAQLDTTDTVEHKGIHITAQNEVAVYGLSAEFATTDAYLGLPVSMLGTEYIVLGYKSTPAPNDPNAILGSTPSQADVVAAYDGTTVTITPSTDTPGRKAGVPYSIVLNQGSVYQLRAGIAKTDLSGSIISSDKPVAVFGGNECVFINGTFCDYIVEQLPPVNAWGTAFVNMPLAGLPNGDTFRFLASQDNTTVRLSNGEQILLNRGQFSEQIIIGPSSITSDKPILVAQYENASQFNGNAESDPMMMLVPPFEQFSGDAVIMAPGAAFSTDTGGFTPNFVNVFADLSSGGSVQIDGTPIPASSFTTIDDTQFSGATVQVSTGSHRLTGNIPFAADSYGYARVDSYGYGSGVALSTAPDAALAIEPKATSQATGSQRCTTALVTSLFGEPVGGIGVSFNASGANTASGLVHTDVFGEASFCYTGANAGTDTIGANVGGTLVDTASATWTAGGANVAPFVDAGPAQTVILPKIGILRGIVADDQLPVGATLAVSWQQVSGPAGAVFSSPSSAETNVTFTTAGTYVMQLTASDSVLSTSSNVTVTVLAHPANQAPVVSAGPNITLDFVNNAAGKVHLVGTVSDDGIPATAKLITQWTVVSGPQPVLFSSPTAAETDATFVSTGNPDTYVLRLTADDSELQSTSDVTITLIPANRAPSVNIGPVIPASLTLPANTVSLTPSVSDDGRPAGVPLTFQWSTTFGPAPVVFANPTAQNTTATFPAAGTYNLMLSVSDSEFTSTSSTQVVVNPANAAPIVSVPSQATITLPGTLTVTASATDDGKPAGSTLAFQWTEVSGPAPVTFSAPTALTTTVTFTQPGSYQLSISANDSQLTGTAFITVGVNRQNQPPVVFPGPDQTLALPTTTITLAGTVTDDGLPAGVPLSIQWSEVSGPAAVTFTSPTTATTNAVFTAAGNYVLQLSASDSQFTAARTMNVTVFAAPQNQPPTVSAGPNQTVTIPSLTNPAQAFLNASLHDDGLPVGKPVTVSWSQVSGPAAATFVSPTSQQGTVKFTVAGVYVLRITATDTQLTSTSDVQITVNPPVNLAPVLSSLVDPVITLPTNTTSFSTATVSDDGLPVGAPVTVLLTQTGGPAPIQFADPTNLHTLMTFSVPGSYGVRITASDTQFTSTAALFVTVNQANKAPVIGGTTNYNLVQPANTLAFNNTVTDDGQPAGAPLTSLWTQVSGPQLAHFTDPTNPQTTATFPAAGAYVLKLTASDTQLTTIAEIDVHVQPPDAPAPVVKILSPGDSSIITQPVPVVITTTADSATVDYALNNPDGTVPQTFTFLGSFGSASSSPSVGTFDPTLLPNGIYTIRLTGQTNTSAGLLKSTDSVTVTVQGRAKVGVFRLAFRDLTIPLPGMSIDIVRSYDSTDTGIHDFGLAWSLSVNSARLQRNRNIGFGWTETATQTAFPTFCLISNNDRFVTITFPDNRIYKFRAVASPECDIINPITVPTLAFEQVPTGAGTAGATLVPADGASLLVDGAVPGPVNLVDTTGQPYNPKVFRLTTMEGFSYVIDQTLGVTSISDPNNNVINIGPNGISSSSGVSVGFVRNTNGQITQINDPQGNQLKYGYDSLKRLTTFTDGANNLTTFGYPDGFLSSIIDARGVNVLQSFFSGNKVSTVTDASGKITHFTYNTTGQTQTVVDRLGNSTTYDYDDDGNITSTTDSLGKTTFATYDQDDNKLTETNALGKTTAYTYDQSGNRLTETDPLGNVTTYTYNGRHQVLSVKDALGHSTVNNYDANGNLLDSTDPLGKKTTYTYNSQGLPLTVTDPLTGKTTFAYDSTGHVTSQTDALNNVTSFTYDANGNRLTQAVKRTKSDGTLETLTTTYLYDGDNRVTKTTNPDLTFTRVAYNPIGKQSDTFDALNRNTHYDYDANGRLSKVTYPDTTFESYTYDLDDRKLTMTDRASRLTSYTYDAVGRLTKTTYPDTSTTQTAYDAAGRVTQTIDGLNHSTSYGYDNADRRTTVTDAAQKITAFAYDAAGNQTSITDALTHKTQFGYDAANRRVLATYQDQSTDAVVYDANGRQVSKTDQAGKTTQFGYDLLGRLTSVTQFLNSVPLVTTYAYDEIGNRVSQTDANGHITKFAYDQLGRRSSRTLPLGQSESYGYDAAGNLTTRTDFNNHTTTYVYDLMNHLTHKTADIFFSTGACATGVCGATQVGYTYTATGRRQSMTDIAGLTNYTYDTRDRLLTKAAPLGTLTYTYDAQGNMITLKSSNVGGASMTYAYDPLNRLASVTDASSATTYTYDAVGNLSGFAYPNGVVTSYNYNTLNRLTNMQSTCATGTGCGAPGTALASYAYTLGAAGNRLSVAELSGRTVNYGYDDLYRLTSETIAGATSQNGAVSYQYDSVGNRLQRSSTVPALPATGLLNYDANDRTSTDPYDADGNLLNGGVGTNVYDFENHLVAAGGVALAYDGDGNRVKESVVGVTTSYLVADQNLTGYAQVVDELQSGVVSRTYSYGLSLISQKLTANGQGLSFYGYDGHGSVRFLTSSTGAVTDTYNYDAFGTLISSTGSTPNNYLFAGEQFDPALGIYYNRARYLDQRTGRFWSMDSLEGSEFEPVTLHKYLYVSANPVNDHDPSGHEDLATITEAVDIGEEIDLALGRTAAATQYLDKVFQASVILLGTVTAAALLIEGTELLNNRTRNRDGKERRGRIGIQGNDLARQANRFNQSVNSLGFNLPDLLIGGKFSFSRDTLAWGWTRLWPVLKIEGLAALQAMEGKLGDTSLKCRKTAFKQAEAAINAPGGLPEGYSRDFQGENFAGCDGSERVDIHVFKGSAFEK
jgi:RHS repeat-associated protein